MPRLNYPKILLLNLEVDVPITSRAYVGKEKAYELLKIGTGQDFGDDVAAWEKWLNDNSLDLQRIYQSQLPESNWKRLKKKNKK
jgi:hypothetical protein